MEKAIQFSSNIYMTVVVVVAAFAVVVVAVRTKIHCIDSNFDYVIQMNIFSKMVSANWFHVMLEELSESQLQN